MSAYEETNLWKKNLAQQGDSDPYKKARERLRRAFIQTRSAVEPLVGAIAKELPDLTMHDITHLDSLWHIADVLMGDEFEINPAETFVLGMSFLLHDAACSTFAYTKGIGGLRDTDEWTDFVAQNGFNNDDLKKDTLAYQQALFETIRLLHPKQAEKLLTKSWPDLNSASRWLMEDVELRNYYGGDIGKIAASHGQDAAIAEQYWANAAPLTPHSSLEIGANDWQVDRLKIALLLRCVDAAHIDSRRAPDMLACLTQPTGVSREHWIFQNRLGAVGINDQNELYWSGQPFEAVHADAWWRCYSTAQSVDHEIRVANRILKNNNRKELRAKGVAGALDVSVFQGNVPTEGWQPVDVGFQISQVRDVVEKFGGEKLYGNRPYLALRELIQNAADAIRARRIYRNNPEHGRIDISLSEEEGAWWLRVQDDGVGMSRYVLTDVLLNFGRSLWRDAAVREQWKGLAGKHFEAVGQFGIGFFSVFMLGDEVTVTTWRDGDAESNQTTLHLRHRTYARPILLQTPANQRLNGPGTRVSVRLKDGRASLLHKMDPRGLRFNVFSTTSPTEEMSLSQTVGVLAPALDIDVYCQDGRGGNTRAITANDWKDIPPLELLKRLCPPYLESELWHNQKGFCDLVESDGKIVGRASLSRSQISGFGMDTGVLVHQGITVGRWSGTGILLSGNSTDLARSCAQPVCSSGVLTSWGQATYSQTEEKTSVWLSNVLLSLGLPAGKLPLAELAGEDIYLEGIMGQLQKNGLEEIVFITRSPDCPDSMSQADFNDQFVLNGTVINAWLSRFPREDFGLGGWIGTLLPETHNAPRSVWSAIQQCILQAWPDCIWSNEERVVGECNGTEIIVKCAVVRRKV